MKPTDKRNVILLHLSFWVLFILFKFFDYSNNIPAEMAIMLVSVQHVFTIIATYVHYFFLLPLFHQKLWRIYIPSLVVLLVLTMLGRAWLESVYVSGIFNTDYYDTWSVARAVSIFWSTSSFIVFISLIKFTIDRFALESQKKELVNQNLNAELNYLKSQINPHFLFNTLHNLNYLAQVKSDETSAVIIRLSNIMRYMIYESGKAQVPIQQELDYIQDYLELEKIRLNNAFELKQEVSIDSQIQIAPLILIPFIENAFKHGVSDQQNDCWIQISLTAENGSLNLMVANSKLTKNNGPEVTGGVGLKNVKRRLELTYPKQHRLEVDEDDSSYKVHLSINLKV